MCQLIAALLRGEQEPINMVEPYLKRPVLGAAARPWCLSSQHPEDRFIAKTVTNPDPEIISAEALVAQVTVDQEAETVLLEEEIIN